MASLAASQPRRWMECSWGRLAGIHIPMGTLKQGESFGTLRGKCVGVMGQTANDPKSQKNAQSAIGLRMLCRGPVMSPPWLTSRTRQKPRCSVLSWVAQKWNGTGHFLHGCGQELIKRISSKSPTSSADLYTLVPFLILKKMTLGECAQPLFLPCSSSLQLSLSFPKRGTQTQCIFLLFLKGFIVSFKTYSETRWVHQNSHITTLPAFRKGYIWWRTMVEVGFSVLN